MVRPPFFSVTISEKLSTRLLVSKVLFRFGSLLVLLILSLLTSSSVSSFGNFEYARAQPQQQDMLIHVGLSSLGNRSGVTELTRGLDNFLIYDNSTYGIRFLPPDDWDKMEILTDRTTFVEFTSPSRNVTEVTDLPAQLVISIERGLGNITTLQQYLEASDRLLSTFLGDFNATSQPVTLSEQEAISRTMSIKNLESGNDIIVAQVVALKNNVAYVISYTAPASIYNNYVPIIERVVNSFQITR
jgi:hypothetical protein